VLESPACYFSIDWVGAGSVPANSCRRSGVDASGLGRASHGASAQAGGARRPPNRRGDAVVETDANRGSARHERRDAGGARRPEVEASFGWLTFLWPTGFFR